MIDVTVEGSGKPIANLLFQDGEIRITLRDKTNPESWYDVTIQVEDLVRLARYGANMVGVSVLAKWLKRAAKQSRRASWNDWHQPPT